MLLARVVVLMAGSLLLATPAMAQCSPPAGLSPQQWLSVCGPALQEAYRRGYGQGMPFQAFAESMYQVYARPVPMMSTPMMNACNPGQTQCFNGWLRTCQPGPTGAQWRTGAQRC